MCSSPIGDDADPGEQGWPQDCQRLLPIRSERLDGYIELPFDTVDIDEDSRTIIGDCEPNTDAYLLCIAR